MNLFFFPQLNSYHLEQEQRMMVWELTCWLWTERVDKCNASSSWMGWRKVFLTFKGPIKIVLGLRILMGLKRWLRKKPYSCRRKIEYSLKCRLLLCWCKPQTCNGWRKPWKEISIELKKLKKKTNKKLDENMIGDLAVKRTKAVLRSGGRE